MKNRIIKVWAITTKNNVIIDDLTDYGIELIIYKKRKDAKFFLEKMEETGNWKIVRAEINLIIKK